MQIFHRSPNYRPDIDGLRGISILLVLIFHYFPQWVPGGFVGVDVFFVISGFLITSIILKELEAGTFSIKKFYYRRIRRILPGVIVTGAFILLYGYWVLFPHEFASAGGGVSSGALSFANLFLHKQVNYFDPAGELKPFLHFWSLSVEEQFYFIFPAIMCVAFKYKLNRSWMLRMLLGVAMLSFVYAILLTIRNPTKAFYFPTARAWELLIGSLLAFVPLKAMGRSNIKGEFISLCGLILILIAAFAFTEKDPYPGWRALFPTVGSAMIIHMGQKSWLNSKIISFKVLVFVGLISYPLYLFHWPLISMVRIVSPELGGHLWFKFGLIIVSFVISFLFFYCVEKRVRPLGDRAAQTLLAMTLVIGGGGFAIYKEKISPRIVSIVPEVVRIEEAYNDYVRPYDFFEHMKEEVMAFRSREGEDTVLFLGDSNMEQYCSRIAKLVEDNEESALPVIFSYYGGQVPIPGAEYYDDYVNEVHKKFMASSLRIAHNKKVDTVVIAAQWVGYLGGSSKGYLFYEEGGKKYDIATKLGLEKILESLRDMIRGFVQKGKKVYLVLTIPTGVELGPQHFVKRSLWGGGRLEIPKLSADQWREKSMKVHRALRQVAHDTGAIIIDPAETLCQGGLCLNIFEQGPVYKDGCHLRQSYVRDHIKFFDDVVLNSNEVRYNNPHD